MRVVPGRAVEVRFEGVSERFTRCNRTLLHRGHAIEPRSLSLKDAMPMQRSTFFWACDLVVHGDLESITPISL